MSTWGPPDALDEAQSLATSDAPTDLDHAFARLVLVQLQHNLGHITDQLMADACDEIVTLIGSDDSRLSLGARLLALDARSVRNAESAQWPTLLAEARRILTAAETTGALAVAAGACAAAGDLANRIVDKELSSELLDLRVIESFGGEVPLPVRLARAQQFIARSDEILELFQKAVRLAGAAESPIVLARVWVTYSRYLTLNSASAAFKTGKMEEFGPSIRVRDSVRDGGCRHLLRLWNSPRRRGRTQRGSRSRVRSGGF